MLENRNIYYRTEKSSLTENSNVTNNNNNNNKQQTTIPVADAFGWREELFDFALPNMTHIMPTKKAPHTLIAAKCREYYQGNKREEDNINEFESTYQSERAIWWYTRDTCFYRIINKALREDNFDVIFAFRSFILDIAKQISSECYHQWDKNQHSTFYRGQLMRKQEVENFTSQQLIATKSFLSTSLDREVALMFSGNTGKYSSNNDIQSVLYEITITGSKSRTTFVNISHLTQFGMEQEVLFNIGASFCINEIVYNSNEHYWLIKLKPCTGMENMLREYDNEDFLGLDHQGDPIELGK